MVRRQGIEPRTNGLRGRWRAFNHAGYRVCVYRNVASWEKVLERALMLSNDAGFGDITFIIILNCPVFRERSNKHLPCGPVPRAFIHKSHRRPFS